MDMNDLLQQLDALHLKEKELFTRLEALQEEKSKLVKDLQMGICTEQTSLSEKKKKKKGKKESVSSIKDLSIGDKVYYSKEAGKRKFDSKGTVLKLGRLRYVFILPEYEADETNTEKRAYNNVRIV